MVTVPTSVARPQTGRSARSVGFGARVTIGILGIGVGIVIGAGCADGAANRSVAGYCEQITANLAALNAPQIATADDIVTTLELYRAIGDGAPAAVAPEWQTMIDSLETAATVVPGDAESIAVANEVALSSQAAATRIQQYTQQTCHADIGTPVPPTNPVTATTVTPTSTT